VVGFKGLAPYRFAVDVDAFASEKGDLSARLETEYALLLTQRVVAQPRLEVNASARDVDALGIGAGVGDVALGLRLRYEVRRELAPYVGVSRTWSTGGTADRLRAAGGEAAQTAWVAGVRLWY
jgi:copper resistance protein B